MANNLEHNLQPSELESYALNKQGKGNNNQNGNSYENVEFRNFDTIDVEVKDSSTTYNVDKLCLSRGITIKKLQNENKKLKNDLEKAGVDLESSRRTFEAVTGELKKQLDVAQKRESEGIATTLDLRLENEKLHVLLESKQSLVDKLKKELLNVKRALKVAIKDICTVSGASQGFNGGLEDRPYSARSPCPRSSKVKVKVRFADNNSDSPKNRQT
ncbi:uncharacterized protein LOC133528706 [Cydia pomonella]|uniref:uncharacterized protein LOC133528706 n=1 Tax=Cydia pomonella TaxID=82600 RepID=UPI002ADD42CE|nr:uncharacterized protein LOC133528706 [Cydia pomonella]